MSFSAIASEDAQYSRLSNYIYSKIIHWHESTERDDTKRYSNLYEAPFTLENNLARNPVYDSICRVEQWIWDLPLQSGTGVLVHAGNKKAILTSAHVTPSCESQYYVYFDDDDKPRRVIGKPVYFARNIDLAILFLDDYPDIVPAKRSYHQPLKEVFLHIAGYGYYYYRFKKYLAIIFHHDENKHIIAQTFKLTNIHTEQHQKEFSEFKCFQMLGEEYYLASAPESDIIHHPVTNEEYPNKPVMQGFSGSPAFNQDDEVVAIVSASHQAKSFIASNPLCIKYPFLSKMQIYHDICSTLMFGCLLAANIAHLSDSLWNIRENFNLKSSKQFWEKGLIPDIPRL